jgi:hypothetical protein
MTSELILGEPQKTELARLRRKAAAEPIDVRIVMRLTETRDGFVEHLTRMETYTIPLPTAFMVTFTCETGQPIGPCRHLSMSSLRQGHRPSRDAVWKVAEELGFVGGLDRCTVWEYEIGHGNVAINVIQPIELKPQRGS